MSKFDEEEEERNDYFEENIEPVKKEKKPKTPALKPEDPEYWEQPESEWEHLKPRHATRIWIWVAVVGLALGILWGLYLRLFNPYITEASQFGYVESIDRQGEVMGSFEGVLLPYKDLMDTTRVYKKDFRFSVKDPQVAVQLKRMQFANRPVRVEYSVYHTAMPWRGKEKILVTQVDTVNPRKILPPEYTPDIY